MLIGYLFKNKNIKNGVFRSLLGLFIGLSLAYLGKLSFYSETIRIAGKFGWVFNTIGPLLMTLGFSIMILTSLRSVFLSKIIGNRIFSFIGRISYSLYLWHALLLGFVHNYLNDLFSSSAEGVFYLFAISLILIIPVSWLSYTLLEAFYFKNKINKA
ncbi:MAG: acyltransferase family protein [Bacteroidota bacterium]